MSSLNSTSSRYRDFARQSESSQPPLSRGRGAALRDRNWKTNLKNPNHGSVFPSFPTHRNNGTCIREVSHLNGNEDATQDRIADLLKNSPDKRVLGLEEGQAFCAIVKKSPSFNEAIRKIANKKCQFTEFLVSALLSVQDDQGYPFKKELIKQLQHPDYKTMRTIPNLNIMINCSGTAGDFEIASELFNEAAEELKSKDFYTYYNYIKAAWMNGKFEEAKRTFSLGVNLGFINSAMCNSYINAASLHNQFLEARRGFDVSISCNQVDAMTCGIYLHAALKQNDIEQALRAIDEAERRGFKSNHLDSGQMKLGQKLGNDLAKMTQIFNDACRSDQLTPYTCVFYMNAVEKSKEKFDKIQTAFDEANARQLLSPQLIARYIKLAKRYHNFSEAKKAFDLAMEQKLATPAVCTLYVEAALKPDQFDETKRAFLYAASMGLVNERMLASYYSAAVKFNQPLEAERIRRAADLCEIPRELLSQRFNDGTGITPLGVEQNFALALHFETKNIEIFNAYLKILKDPVEIERVFKAAEEREIVDSTTVRLYLRRMRQLGKVEESQRVYEMAQARGIADFSAHMVFLDTLMSNQHEREAEDLFRVLQISPTIKVQAELPALDLHGYSYSGGYLALRQYMEMEDCPNRFGVIVGRGSLEYGNLHAFRDYMLTQINNNLPDWQCSLDPSNEGWIILERKELAPAAPLLPEPVPSMERVSQPVAAPDPVQEEPLVRPMSSHCGMGYFEPITFVRPFRHLSLLFRFYSGWL